MKTRKEIPFCVCGSYDHLRHPTETPKNQKQEQKRPLSRKPYYLSGGQWEKLQEKRMLDLIEAVKRFMYLGTIADKERVERAIAKLEGK